MPDRWWLRHGCRFRLCVRLASLLAVSTLWDAATAVHGQQASIDEDTRHSYQDRLFEFLQTRNRLAVNEAELNARADALEGQEPATPEQLRRLEELQSIAAAPPEDGDVPSQWQIDALTALDPVPSVPEQILTAMAGHGFDLSINVLQTAGAVAVLATPSAGSSIVTGGEVDGGRLLITVAENADGSWYLVLANPDSSPVFGFVHTDHRALAPLR